MAALSRIGLRSVFNPYADRCLEYDRHDAARIRRRNLVHDLEAARDMCVDTIWIARDLDYRSGRRTCIPIMDELRLECAAATLGGRRFHRATLGPSGIPTVWRRPVQFAEGSWWSSLLNVCVVLLDDERSSLLPRSLLV